MDLLATEILTITNYQEAESDFGIYYLNSHGFDKKLFLVSKIITGKLVLAENGDF